MNTYFAIALILSTAVTISVGKGSFFMTKYIALKLVQPQSQTFYFQCVIVTNIYQNIVFAVLGLQCYECDSFTSSNCNDEYGETASHLKTCTVIAKATKAGISTHFDGPYKGEFCVQQYFRI
jgi:hypothetical protein